MNALKVVVSELWGLFVDDGVFAGLLLAWCSAARVALPSLPLPAGGDAVVLFLGCVAILLGNVAVAGLRRGRVRWSVAGRIGAFVRGGEGSLP